MKRLTALLLAAVITISLFTGCGKKENPGAEERPEFTYTSAFTQLQSEDQSIRGFAYSGRRVYYLSFTSGYEEVLDEETGEYSYRENSIYHVNSMAPDGTDLKVIAEFAPSPVEDGWDGRNNVQAFLASTDGMWICEQAYMSRVNLPEGMTQEDVGDKYWDYYESKQSYTLSKLDYDGNKILSSDLTRFLGEEENAYGFYVNDMIADALGNLYLVGGDTIICLDKSGDFRAMITGESWFSSSVRMSDGSVGVTSTEWGDGGETMMVSRINIAAGKLDEPEMLPSISSNRLYMGNDEYDYFYTNGLNFMGLKMDSGESELLFNFTNCDVDADYLENLIITDEGSVLAFSTQYDDQGETTGMYRIYKVRTESLPEKTYLSYACLGLDSNVRREIIKFNRTSQKYRIEVIDYSQFDDDNGKGSSEGALKKLTTELLSGKIPDLFSCTDMPMRQLSAKGYLEDLWPYIESTYGRQGVVEPFFNALSTEGKLYQISPSFTVRTVAGQTDVVGDHMGWNMKELMRAYKTLWPEATVFSVEYTKSDALHDVCAIMLDGFVNWSNGQVSFNSPNFVGILEFANMFPATFDAEKYYREEQGDPFPGSSAILEGYQLLEVLDIGDFIEWRRNEMSMGGDMTFVGYPVESGVGSAFSTDMGIAMSATCADKAGAWEFMSRFLSESYQYRDMYGFPSNKAAFDRKLLEARTPVYRRDERGAYILDENGEKIEEPKGWGGFGEIYYDAKIAVSDSVGFGGGQIYHLTDEQVEKITSLINETTRIYGFDDAIYEIIVDRASAYFSGQQSAQDAAKAINSRAFLYVNEQR